MTQPHFRRWTGIAIGLAVGTVVLWQEHRQPERDEGGPKTAAFVGIPSASESPKPVAAGTPPALPGARSGLPWQDIAGWERLTPREKLVTLLSRPFALKTQGQVARLELARDEFFIKGGSGLTKIPAQPDAEALLQRAEEWKVKTGTLPQLVFYPPGTERNSSNRRVLTSKVLLHTAAAHETMLAATAAGCETVREMQGLPGYVLVEDKRLPGASLLMAATLSKRGEIDSSLPMLGASLVKMSIPDDPTKDPLFGEQWHLKSTRSLVSGNRIDLNLFPANAAPVWESTQGRGVVIGIVDDGIETIHPDLWPHYIPWLSRDFLDTYALTPDHKADTDGHGTCVAGLAAATGGNGLGVAGAAPQAFIAGLRMISQDEVASEDSIMEALSFSNDFISIKNCSWGKNLRPWELGTLGEGLKAALRAAVTHGRGSKGVIMPFSAGNSHLSSDGIPDYLQGNKSGYANSIYTFAVGAVCATGIRSAYSEPGSHLLTCAPSNGNDDDYSIPWMTTTDRSYRGYNPDPNGYYTADMGDTKFTRHFSGTSASTALVSGVIALMLEAQPDLGWRDVKEILLRSGTKVEPTDRDWVSRSGGGNSLPPIKHNHQYGGGMVNAANAVALARQWVNLGEMKEQSQTFNGSMVIPDYNGTGITISQAFSNVAPLRVEQVEVEVTMHHPYRGDVSIDLISPAGTVSHLAKTTLEDNDYDTPEADRGYQGWTFASARHWGESSIGTWKVVFKDLASQHQGTVEKVTIRLHGTAAPAVLVTAAPQDRIVPLGAVPAGTALFSVGVSGQPDFAYQWLKGTARIAGATSSSWSVANITSAYAGTYSVQVSNLTGNVTSAPAKLGVVDVLTRSVIVNEGKTLTLQATAAGPGISYQWRRNGVPVSNDSRTTGATQAKLVVTGVTTNDVASYACRVTVGSATASTGSFDVQVQVPPQIDPGFLLSNTSVSEPFLMQVQPVVTGAGVIGVPKQYSIAGLPAGLTWTSAGLISGRSNVGGTFQIAITATNAAGSQTVYKTLTVEKLPVTTVGSFSGLVAPDSLANGNFGGAISLVVAPVGTFSGRLSLGPYAYAVSGRMNAALNTDPAAEVIIKRPGKAASLRVDFAISRADGHLTGTVKDTFSFTTAFDAWRNPYSSTHRSTDIARAYTAWIDPPDDPGAPQGTALGLVKINTLGGVSWLGRLADHTVVSRSTTIGEGGDVPLHFLLYAGTGSAQGWMQVSGPNSPQPDRLSGAMRWVKNAQAANNPTRSYKSGFSASGLAITGCPYATPVKGTVLWGMPGGSDTQLMFANGGVEAAATYSTLEGSVMRVAASHALLSLAPKPTGMLMHINTTTGVFNGRATLPDSKVSRYLQFFGVICPGLGKGKGYFLLPQLPNTATSPLLSGAVEWVPAEVQSGAAVTSP